jgi:ribosome modulation factor
MLTPGTLQVCKQHYNGYQAKINGCGKCPIRAQCITTKPTRTEQELQAWEQEVNDASAKWLAGQA